MMGDKLVSVVIPVYNVEKYLRECMDSVLGQTYENIEVICVDDASTDSSLQILYDYQNKDHRVRVIVNAQNGGLSFARNRGLAQAEGKYIYFLDSDDYILQNSIYELVSCAEKHHTDCIYFDSLLQKDIEISSPDLQFKMDELNEIVMEGPRLFSILIERNVYSNSVCRQFWNKDFLRDNQLTFEEGLLGEDGLFSPVAMLYGKRMLLVNKQYHVYRKRGGSLSSNVTSGMAVSAFKTYCSLLRFWISNSFEVDVNNAIDIYLEKKVFKSARRNYLRNKHEVTEENFDNVFERHLFKLLLEDKYDNYRLDVDIVRKIKKFDNVIVYGAGAIAVEVVSILEREKIKIISLAVTTKHENTRGINNIPVNEIKDLEYLNKNSVIVYGLSKRSKEEVIKTINAHGFYELVFLPLEDE